MRHEAEVAEVRALIVPQVGIRGGGGARGKSPVYIYIYISIYRWRDLLTFGAFFGPHESAMGARTHEHEHAHTYISCFILSL